ncbi:MAG TPA: DUF4870 domain-containing protein [Blastocatellia bacterium]
MSYPPSSYPPPGGEQGGGKTKTLSLDFNIAAMLCYLPICCIGPIVAIIILVTEPKESRFVRYHALQSLFLDAVYVLIYIVIWVLTIILAVGSSTVGGTAGNAAGAGVSLLFLLFYFAFGIIVLICTVMGMIKAYKYQIWKLPVIGNLAEKNA